MTKYYNLGDIMSVVIKNLNNLIRMPHGCGEQNMLNFVPNIVVLNYLNKTNQLTAEIEEKAIKYLQVGFQRELTYRHIDGSFSAFGHSDASGSTWLTAFVVRSLRQATAYIDIEESIFVSALEWLSKIQVIILT